jgi:hypothetical protein
MKIREAGKQFSKKVVLTVFATLFVISGVFAASSHLPQTGGQTTPASATDLFLDIARFGYSNTLDAERTSAKLIFGQNTGAYIGIYDGNFCYASNYDSNGTAPGYPRPPYSVGTCNSPSNVDDITYTFRTLQNGPNVPGRSINLGTGTTTNTGEKIFHASDFATNGWSFVNVSSLLNISGDTDDKYFVQLDVSWVVTNGGSGSGICNSGECGGVNAFKLWIPTNSNCSSDPTYCSKATPGSFVTYATDNNSAYPLGIQERPIDPERYGTYSFQFAPECSIPPGARINRVLQWQNADYGDPGAQGINPASGAKFGGKIGWILHNDTTGRNVDSMSGASLGSLGLPPGGFPSEGFIAGDKYTWTWYNVDSHNGVQIWMPFDGYNYNRQCWYLSTSVSPANVTKLAGSIQAITAKINNLGPNVSKKAHLDLAIYDGSGNIKDSLAAVCTTPLGAACFTWSWPTDSSWDSNRFHVSSAGNCSSYDGNNPWDKTSACSHEHWTWVDGNGVAKSANESANVTINIDANTPISSKVCFGTYASPQANTPGPQNEANSPGKACITVDNPANPTIEAHGGDVHAGGGYAGDEGNNAACSVDNGLSGSGNDGSVSTQDDGSFGDYVVSAGGPIDNFGSSGVSTWSNAASRSLLFNNNGTYGSYGFLCRPDITSAAASFLPVKNDTTTPGLVAADVQAGGGRVVEYDGNLSLGALSITGRSTLYVKGNLTLTGNISPTGNYSVNGPSLGVVVTGNIYIRPTVTNMFGYYFQGDPNENLHTGAIWTCAGPAGDPGWASAAGQGTQCAPVLKVYGFLSADQFHFERTGAVGGSGPVQAHIINPLSNAFNYDFGLLLVAPPPGFGKCDVPGQCSASFQGERPPLY